MIYGKLTDGKLQIYGRADGDTWQGTIQYRDGERKTVAEMIADNNLLPVIVPQDFNGVYHQYNCVQNDGKIVLADLKAEVKAEIAKQVAKARIAELKRLLADTDYKVTKCSECQLLGLDMPYDVAELQQSRQSWREQINELEGRHDS